MNLVLSILELISASLSSRQNELVQARIKWHAPMCLMRKRFVPNWVVKVSFLGRNLSQEQLNFRRRILRHLV